MQISDRTFQAEKTACTKTLRQNQDCSALGRQQDSWNTVENGKCGNRQGKILELNILDPHRQLLKSTFFKWAGKPLEDLSRDNKHCGKKKKKNVIPEELGGSTG